MPSVRVLTAHHPFWRETTKRPTISATSSARYTSAPVLKPMPRSLTKNSSKLPANWTAPLMSASCTNPSKAMDTAPVMARPFHENA